MGKQGTPDACTEEGGGRVGGDIKWETGGILDQDWGGSFGLKELFFFQDLGSRQR